MELQGISLDKFADHRLVISSETGYPIIYEQGEHPELPGSKRLSLERWNVGKKKVTITFRIEG